MHVHRVPSGDRICDVSLPLFISPVLFYLGFYVFLFVSSLLRICLSSPGHLSRSLLSLVLLALL